MKKFIFKTRTIEAADRNPYRPRGQVKYGRWKTVSSHNTLEEALEALRKQTTGLLDKGVFYDGQRLCDWNGYVYAWRQYTIEQIVKGKYK